MAKPKILPVDTPGDHAQGQLSNRLTKKDIEKVLGFPPNVQDDPEKVKNSWGFTVWLAGYGSSKGVRCGIWDYKGTRWSTFGPAEIFKTLFGDENYADY